MEKARKRLLAIWHAPTAGPSEIILALIAVAYGVGLLLPRDEFSIYRSQGEMATTFSENAWGLMLTAAGSCRIVSVLMAYFHGRLLTTLILIALWLYLSFSFLTASPLNPRVVALSTLALCDCWTLFRIRRRE